MTSLSLSVPAPPVPTQDDLTAHFVRHPAYRERALVHHNYRHSETPMQVGLHPYCLQRYPVVVGKWKDTALLLAGSLVCLTSLGLCYAGLAGKGPLSVYSSDTSAAVTQSADLCQRRRAYQFVNVLLGVLLPLPALLMLRLAHATRPHVELHQKTVLPQLQQPAHRYEPPASDYFASGQLFVPYNLQACREPIGHPPRLECE